MLSVSFYRMTANKGVMMMEMTMTAMEPWMTVRGQSDNAKPPLGSWLMTMTPLLTRAKQEATLARAMPARAMQQARAKNARA